MKKRSAFLISLILVILTACNIPEKITPEQMNEFMAETAIQNYYQVQSLTPPTPTPTETPLPTETPTPTVTVTPTPTIQPTAAWSMHEKGKAQILVLYYYDIANGTSDDAYYQWESDAYVPSIEFEQQVRILYELGYTSIGLSDMVKVLTEGGELPERPVMFTFDSTELGQYKNAFPILEKYGFIGNLFVQANHIDAKNSLSAKKLKKMIDAGWEIGSAGYYGNGIVDYGTEIAKSKSKIAELLDVEVDVFAYPDGYTDAAGEIVSRTARYGYKAAFAGDLRSTDLNADNIYYLPRYLILKNTSYNDFFSILPWKEGNVSQETMEWTLPTPTLEPEAVEATKSFSLTQMAEDAQLANAE